MHMLALLCTRTSRCFIRQPCLTTGLGFASWLLRGPPMKRPCSGAQLSRFSMFYLSQQTCLMPCRQASPSHPRGAVCGLGMYSLPGGSGQIPVPVHWHQCWLHRGPHRVTLGSRTMVMPRPCQVFRCWDCRADCGRPTSYQIMPAAWSSMLGTSSTLGFMVAARCP